MKMPQFCTMSIIQVGIFFILTCSIKFSNGTLVTSEELKELKLELKQLETKLETKFYQLKEINIRLEEKVTQLEAKNAELEIKVQQQEPGSNNCETINQLTAKLNGIPRTCQDLRAADPSLPSGMHWIDPDGQSIGDSPIYVYCDMTTGSTAILHDSESPIDVGHCAEPGCYSRSINYNASIRQIKALAELSAECHQSIKYNCNYAPFEFDKVPYAWWIDRDGNSQYFWAGSNAGGLPRKHFCQCGIDGNCVDNSLKCNCDIAAPIQLADEGVIEDKNVLPVTQLNFGRTLLETSSGIHTLGPFECTGSVALTRMPTSCEDLWLIGHTLNGFYSVLGSTMMESVYCDFTKLYDNEGVQKWIGYVDVKSAPVHFYVQRNSNFTAERTPITFDLARTNKGNAMNLTSGIFTAPLTGIYFFSFTGHARFPNSTFVHLGVCLYFNGDYIGESHVDESNTVTGQRSTVSLQSTLNLKSDDQVWVQINYINPVVVLDDEANNHFTHFTGFMLEEEIVTTI